MTELHRSAPMLPCPPVAPCTALLGFRLSDLHEPDGTRTDRFSARVLLDHSPVGAAHNDGLGGPDTLDLARGALPRWLDITTHLFRQHGVPTWHLALYRHDLPLLFLRDLARCDALAMSADVYRVRPEWDGHNALSLLTEVLTVPTGADAPPAATEQFIPGRGWVTR